LQHIKDKFPEVLAQYINAVDVGPASAMMAVNGALGMRACNAGPS